ncbi:hypothetical protein XELAEV_18026573mg [Xenopus laevis]|uniref:Cystatin domain-containing protein n=2 Tax=Xenopus laevis TaxID=8355 RepID=A0A974CU02_XENLA|nr:hypothetical protein XELAEV_18026573mg [Xenopus laevis]
MMSCVWLMLPLFILTMYICTGTYCALDFQLTTVDPGFPRNISTNDPAVQKAARVTVYAYNNKSNDSFLFKDLEVQKAMIQIVKGIKYLLQTKIGRTVCPKKEFYNLDQCDFQQDSPLKQTFTCYSEVWNITWLHVETVPVLRCQELDWSD